MLPKPGPLEVRSLVGGSYGSHTTPIEGIRGFFSKLLLRSHMQLQDYTLESLREVSAGKVHRTSEIPRRNEP